MYPKYSFTFERLAPLLKLLADVGQSSFRGLDVVVQRGQGVGVRGQLLQRRVVPAEFPLGHLLLGS